MTRRPAVLPALVAGAIALAAALVFTRALGTRTNYDEGVYLGSLDALRAGYALGDEVYASQPPAFYAILRLLAAPFGNSIEGIRLSFALLAVAGLIGAICLGWRLYGAGAGLLAGALVAVAPPYPTLASTVSADVPSVVLGVWALALIAFALPARSRAWAVAAGAAVGLAVLVKPLGVPFVVPLVALILVQRAGRRLLPAVLVGALSVGVVFAIAHAGALPELWDSVFGDHAGAGELGSTSENARWIAELLHPRTPFTWLVLAGLVSVVFSRDARRTWPLWTLVPACMAFLLAVRPLADHHLVLLSVAYALAAGPAIALAARSLPGWVRAVTVSGLVLLVAAGIFQEQRRLHRNDVAEPREITWAVESLERATPDDALVVTDQPITVFLARRPFPPQLVDVSNTRVTGGGLTAEEILAVIDEAAPDAVVAARMFRTLSEVIAELERRYPFRARCGDATVYLPDGPEEPLPSCPA